MIIKPANNEFCMCALSFRKTWNPLDDSNWTHKLCSSGFWTPRADKPCQALGMSRLIMLLVETRVYQWKPFKRTFSSIQSLTKREVSMTANVNFRIPPWTKCSLMFNKLIHEHYGNYWASWKLKSSEWWRNKWGGGHKGPEGKLPL